MYNMQTQTQNYPLNSSNMHTGSHSQLGYNYTDTDY